MKNEPSRIVFALAGMGVLTGLCATPTVVAFAALTLLSTPSPAAAQEVGCSASARLLRFACAADLRDDFFTATARCIDSNNPSATCIEDAEDELDDGREECGEVFAARLDLCEALDDATHEPPFGLAFAADFVDPTEIGVSIAPNPYFPLVAGNRWTYEDAEETIVVEVLAQTKLIDGITCVTVNDIVTEDDDVIEDTDDWFAQDTDGNVWYCGEISKNYEVFDGDLPEEPELVDLEGSWKHAQDGAKAGLLLPFRPLTGRCDSPGGQVHRCRGCRRDLERHGDRICPRRLLRRQLLTDSGFHASRAGRAGAQVLRAWRRHDRRSQTRYGRTAGAHGIHRSRTMNGYNDSPRAAVWLLSALLLSLGACSSSDSPANRGQQQAPTPIGLSGVVSDGPVSGGSIYVLNPQQLLDVLGGISPGEDLHDALIGVGAGFVRDTC